MTDMKGGAMRSIFMIGTLVLVSIAGLCYLFRDSTEGYGLLYSSPTTIRIERDTIDLDTVKYGEKKQISFRICNTGEVPLLIRDVRPSCGCTEAQWEKRPVQPGEETVIFVTFEPNSFGRFMKSIEVLCNIEQQICILHIMGMVSVN